MTNLTDLTGYFGPESMAWRLYREPVVLFGGFRALILQIAPPAVADGVARYSNFRTDALGRGFRTFRAMATIYFDTRERADATAQRLHKIHTGISGAGYRATDDDLLVWVWATLTDTTLRVFEPFERVLDLPSDWKQQFYRENLLMAHVLGIDHDALPADLDAFNHYFSVMIAENGVLGTSAVSSELTDAILSHRLVFRPLGNLLTAGWLPDYLCTRLNVPKTPKTAHRMTRFFRVLAGCYRFCPRGLRYVPAYHQGQNRVRRARNESPGLLARWYGWLGQRMRLPLGI